MEEDWVDEDWVDEEELAFQLVRNDAKEALERHLNQVSAKVFATKAGQPVEEVLAEIMKRAKAAPFTPQIEAMRPAAESISSGEPYVFELE